MRLLICLWVLAFVACRANPSLPNEEEVLVRARNAWSGNWHASWQVEWDGAPVRGSLVVEVWHADDDRLRIETLEASSPALNGLILVDNGHESWLYDVRGSQVVTASGEGLRIPLVSDGLDAIDWLLANVEEATIDVSGRDTLESGKAIRLNIAISGGDRAILWVHEETGLPSRVELDSRIWGEASFVTRGVDVPETLHPGLFSCPP